MKRTLIISIIALLLISAVVVEKISSRSTEQIIFTGTEISVIKASIEAKYKQGYRLIAITAQSNIIISMRHTEMQKSEIIVVMEK